MQQSMVSYRESCRALTHHINKRKRFNHAHINLDASYITDRVIACAFPSSDGFFSRNTMPEIFRYLEGSHKDHYKVYNLCSERKYDSTMFHGRVGEFPFPPNEPPPIQLIHLFLKDANKWLEADPLNVICVHCDSGRDRTGLMICCWLLQSRKCQYHAYLQMLLCYKNVRGGKAGSVTLPSQRRYVEYFEQILNSGMPPPQQVLLEKIVMHSIPSFNLFGGCSPWFSITRMSKNIYYSKSLHGKKGKGVVDFDCGSIHLQGDIVITFYDSTFSQFMFRVAFHTSFLRGRTLTFYPRDIDGPHADVAHKRFLPEFKFVNVEEEKVEEKPVTKKRHSLKDIMDDPVLLRSFRDYLVANRCEENLELLQEVDLFRRHFSVTNPLEHAKKIYETFIMPGGFKEANITHSVRTRIESMLDEPVTDMFDEAAKEVFHLMRNDSYPRYMLSDLYIKATSQLLSWKNSALSVTKNLTESNAASANSVGNGKTNILQKIISVGFISLI